MAVTAILLAAACLFSGSETQAHTQQSTRREPLEAGNWDDSPYPGYELDWADEWQVYHNFTSLEYLLVRMAQEYPGKTRVYEIGSSVQGRELWVMELSAYGLGEQYKDDGRPHIKYIANMHGNEAVGRELLLRLMQYMLESTVNRTADSDAIEVLLQNTHVHILASMNPDGFENSVEGECGGDKGRYNANGVDLNRNFPDRFNRSQGVLQPETQSVMGWLANTPFSLSANYHGGQLVANYPYDSTADGQVGYARSPDDGVFRHLAHTYANAHPTMHQGLRNCAPTSNRSFADGITNGAEWYVIDGGMQDYNYLHSNAFELTIEMGCCKYPQASELEQQWENHRPALLAYLMTMFQSAKGRMLSATNLTLVRANVTVRNENGTHHTTPTPNGYFWRLLTVGQHTLTFSANGHVTVTRIVQIESGKSMDLGVVKLAATPTTGPTPPPLSTTSTSAAETTGPPDPLRRLTVGAWIGVTCGILAIIALLVVVMMNLRRFTNKRRSYSQMGASKSVLLGGMGHQQSGRLY